MIAALLYTLFYWAEATDPPSTFVGVRRFDPVAGDNSSTSFDQVHTESKSSKMSQCQFCRF